MRDFRTYDISFSGLKLGKHHFEFPIDKKFFDHFHIELEFEACAITASVELEKFSSFLNLTITTHGTISVYCDVCNEPLEQYVENKIVLIVKFSTEFDDSNETILTLPLGSNQLNVAQYIYESILLSIPMKHLHDECNDIENELEEPQRNEKEEISNPIWEKLKDIKKLN